MNSRCLNHFYRVSTNSYVAARGILFLFLALVLPAITANCYAQAKQHLLQGQHNKLRDSLVVHSDTSVPVIITKIENYSYIIDHTNFLFRDPLNISPIYLELNETEKRLEGFKSRLEKNGKRMNLRSINSGIVLLNEIAGQLALHQRSLSDYSSQLSQSNQKVKKIVSDPTLKMQLSDSILSEQLGDLLTEGKALDSLQGQVLGRVNLLLNHVSIDLLQANDIISDMGYLSTEKKIQMWHQEESPLFNTTPGHYSQGLADVFGKSLLRSGAIIVTYLSVKWKILSITVLLFIFFFVLTASNLSRVKNATDSMASLLPVHFIKRSLVACTLFAFLTCAPFFFANPPMSYLHLVELLRLLLFGFIIWPFLAKKTRLWFFLIGIAWILFASDDILLDSAFGERWFLFLTALSLIFICIQKLRSRGPLFVSVKEPPAIKPVLSISLTFAVLSIIFNLTGRLSLAKIAGITAIQTIALALTLWLFFNIVLEAVYLQFKAFTRRRLSGMFDFEHLQDKSQGLIWVLGIAAWTLSIAHNLTVYDELIDLLKNFINAKRTIGSIVFSFRSIAVFVLIVWISLIFSRFVNFFFGSDNITDIKKKGRIGSLMLIIRLVIWITGFLVGVSAAGIPLDKLSLMIGALGVGIGFGLQNIVNNLVSGIILAFERPIQVGDSIEVGNKAGIVQEIGVRSSKIENAEGAAIIIPNGDLLSQQLVNWTMHDASRRVDFMLTVPMSSDIEKIKSIIVSELSKNENVLKNPSVEVNIQDFAPSAIQLKIMWWVPDLHKAGSVRSGVMQDVYEALDKAGVAFEK
jgi:small-conductance mechanosensitive channel